MIEFKVKQQIIMWLFMLLCLFSCNKAKDLKSYTYTRYSNVEKKDIAIAYSIGLYKSGSIKYHADLMPHSNDTTWYKDMGKSYMEKKENKEYHYSNKSKEKLYSVAVYSKDTIYYYDDEQLEYLSMYHIKKDNLLIEERTYNIIMPQKRMFSDIKINKYEDVISQIVYSETYYEDSTSKETYLEEYIYEYY